MNIDLEKVIGFGWQSLQHIADVVSRYNHKKTGPFPATAPPVFVPLSYGSPSIWSPIVTTTQQPARTTNFAQPGGIVPTLYGRRRVPGVIAYISSAGSYLHIIVLWGKGEFDGCEGVYINDQLSSTYTAVAIETYNGTQAQGVCGLNSYDPGWTYALPGIAYSYIRLIASTEIQDIPRIEAIWRGKKIYDPRNGATAYNANPILELTDLLTDTADGGRIATAKIDWNSVAVAANYWDAMVGSPAQKRGQCHFYFSNETTLDAAIKTIAGHCLALLLADSGGIYRVNCAWPVAVSVDFQEKEIYNLSVLPLASADMVNTIRWTWTDPTTWQPVEEVISDPALGLNDEIHERAYDLGGFMTKSESRRVALFWLNSRLSDMQMQFTTYNYKGLQVGDVFTLTHSIGIAAKQLIASMIAPQPDGSYQITAREYDPAFFNTEVVTEPTYGDTNLPLPTDTPSAATNLVLTELLLQLKDTSWISCIEVSWSPSSWPWVRHYEIWANQDSGDYVLSGTTTGSTYELRAAKELSSYGIKVVTVSPWSKKSAGLAGVIIPQGKYLPPVWKGGAVLTGQEAGDIVFLSWYMADNTPPATDIDIVGYELRRGRTTDTWNTAAVIDPKISALSYQDKTCPAGTWRYFLRALDSVGNYTATALSLDVAVTLNPNLGFQLGNTPKWDTASGAIYTNMGYSTNAQDFAHALCPIDPSYTTLGTRFPGPTLGSGAGGTYTYLNLPAPATASCVSAPIDIGVVINGQWTLSYNWQKIGTGSASLAPKLLLSTDGATWTTYSAASVFSAAARYVKAQFDLSSSSPDTTYFIIQPIRVQIQASPRGESGEAAVVGGSYPLTFTQTYVAINKVRLIEKYAGDTLDPRKAVYDALTLTGMTIRLFDKNNATAAGTVKYEVEGN